MSSLCVDTLFNFHLLHSFRSTACLQTLNQVCYLSHKVSYQSPGDFNLFRKTSQLFFLLFSDPKEKTMRKPSFYYTVFCMNEPNSWFHLWHREVISHRPEEHLCDTPITLLHTTSVQNQRDWVEINKGGSKEGHGKWCTNTLNLFVFHTFYFTVYCFASPEKSARYFIKKQKMCACRKKWAMEGSVNERSFSSRRFFSTRCSSSLRETLPWGQTKVKFGGQLGLLHNAECCQKERKAVSRGAGCQAWVDSRLRGGAV